MLVHLLEIGIREILMPIAMCLLILYVLILCILNVEAALPTVCAALTVRSSGR